ncbi:MAG: hypothetical protein FJW61_03540 [Actinobacteria bacterium]|nr:hypothetical protein [Actinomycetota bacterium]
MDISKIRKKIRDLSLERFKAEMELLKDYSRKRLLYGSVVKKYKACGKGGCKCTRGLLHGPFYYLTYKQDGKTKMIFIKKNMWEAAIKLNDNYRKVRKLRADISKINKKILTLLDEIEKANTVSLSTIEVK